ncbi:MAG: DUF2784 domain-containing protein [Spirochaetes bacterium]|nr:DUF2784 domain-containing protein [Spirochaetota bacterium]
MVSILPELILFLHFAYVLFCVGGELTILGSALLQQVYKESNPPPFLGKVFRWAKSRTLRLVHLVAVGIVGIEGALGWLCPLTIWEYALRRAAGQQVEDEIPLVSRMIRAIIFYDFPTWVFTGLYVGFALLVLATFFWIPPQGKAKQDDPS